MVGVAGTQRRTRANERPQQAANSSNTNLFILQTKPAQNQHEYNRHTQPNIHSEQRKQANSAIELFKSAKFVFPRPSSTIDFATITQPVKSNNTSNESLDNYLLNHVTRFYKSRIIVL